MQIRRIKLHNFTEAFLGQTAEIKLPQNGIVLVHGDNGSGKSTAFIEAPATAAWGKSLRDGFPWVAGVEGFCEIETDAIIATRSVSKSGAKKLLLQPLKHIPGYDAEFGTTSKAQEQLLTFVGDFAVWQRTCVFASGDSKLFTREKDKGRKLLIEGILGLTAFDPALKACRRERDVLRSRLLNTQGTRDQFQDSLQQEEQRLEQTRQTIVSFSRQKTYSQEDLRKAAEIVAALRTQVDDLEKQYRLTSAVPAALQGRITNFKEKLNALKDGLCTTCGQTVESEIIDKIRNSLSETMTQLQTDRKTAREQSAIVTNAIKECRITLETAVLRHSKTKSAILAQKEHDIGVEGLKKLELESLRRIETYNDKIYDADAKLDTIEHELAVAESAETVLGLKGVRPAILSRSLEAIGRVATSYCKMIDPKLQIKILPYTETKSKTVNDDIDIQISGRGGDTFENLSTGQKRGVDFALMIGTALTAAATQPQMAKATMIFDELFDVLDDNMTPAIGTVLTRLAQDRAIIVITHNKSLLAHIDAAMELVVENGRIRTV